MYRTNLSHQELKFSSAVTQADLLVLVDGRYLMTTKGRFFVDKFRELADIVEDGNMSKTHALSVDDALKWHNLLLRTDIAKDCTGSRHSSGVAQC